MSFSRDQRPERQPGPLLISVLWKTSIRSLSALGDCISALTSKEAKRGERSHVPFRNSKLTHVLMDSLGNDSKTLLIVNCSPAPYNLSESNCTLLFAQRAK